eukprot:PhM_4_TR7739/c0_g1_i1/m.94097/K17533/MAP3K19, YSK4; mitogen-activated protein kinase kinase kinase 19
MTSLVSQAQLIMPPPSTVDNDRTLPQVSSSTNSNSNNNKATNEDNTLAQRRPYDFVLWLPFVAITAAVDLPWSELSPHTNTVAFRRLSVAAVHIFVAMALFVFIRVLRRRRRRTERFVVVPAAPKGVVVPPRLTGSDRVRYAMCTGHSISLVATSVLLRSLDPDETSVFEMLSLFVPLPLYAELDCHTHDHVYYSYVLCGINAAACLIQIMVVPRLWAEKTSRVIFTIFVALYLRGFHRGRWWRGSGGNKSNIVDMNGSGDGPRPTTTPSATPPEDSTLFVSTPKKAMLDGTARKKPPTGKLLRSKYEATSSSLAASTTSAEQMTLLRRASNSDASASSLQLSSSSRKSSTGSARRPSTIEIDISSPTNLALMGPVVSDATVQTDMTMMTLCVGVSSASATNLVALEEAADIKEGSSGVSSPPPLQVSESVTLTLSPHNNNKSFTSMPPPPTPSRLTKRNGSGEALLRSRLNTANNNQAAAAVGPTILQDPRSGDKVMKWRRGAVLGRGACGTVNVGLDESSGQLMAVKSLSFNANDPNIVHSMELLQREITVMRRLRHRNIVQYYFAEREGASKVNIFMEYVPGGSLQSVLKQFGPLNETVCARYVKQILEGLVYLHSEYIVHRDIKCGNILLSTDGTVKLSDFGASVLLEGSAMRQSTCGTLVWMAPEVIRSTGHNQSADIWSLGCTVMEMLTGKLPFDHLGLETFGVVSYVGGLTKGIEVPLPDTISSTTAKAFIRACLRVDKADRPSALQLLQHPFISRGAGGSAVSVEPFMDKVALWMWDQMNLITHMSGDGVAQETVIEAAVPDAVSPTLSGPDDVGVGGASSPIHVKNLPHAVCVSGSSSSFAGQGSPSTGLRASPSAAAAEADGSDSMSPLGFPRGMIVSDSTMFQAPDTPNKSVSFPRKEGNELY